MRVLYSAIFTPKHTQNASLGLVGQLITWEPLNCMNTFFNKVLSNNDILRFECPALFGS
jgi:hypothetical protein